MKSTSMNSKKINKGAPSGFLISLLFHAAVFFIAGLLVVFTILPEKPPEFEAPPPVARPKMKLKKPKLKIKKSSQPKPSSRIVAKVKTAKMREIQLPDLAGTGEGLLGGLGMGGEFMDLPDIGQTSLFGNDTFTGSEFMGRVYHLKYSRSKGPASMDPDSFRDVLQKYVCSGWDDSILEKYYQLPRKLYASYFMVPPLPSTLCTDSFGGEDLESYWIFAVYKGKLVYPKDIKFRFWGSGDAYIFVHVDGKEVLLNAWSAHKSYFNWWRGKASKHLSYMLGNMNMAVGDWIELKANEPVDMNVLFGEWAGGEMSGMLLVEVEGEEYPKSYWNGPLLPVFKTQELSWDDLTEIYKYLPENECSLTNGPVFSDFGSPKQIADDMDAGDETNLVSSGTEESPLRQWRLNDGRVITAEFKKLLFDKIVLEDEKGTQAKLSMDQFCDEDQVFLKLLMPPELDIEFSPLSRQRRFPPTRGGLPPEASIYTFKVKVKQVSSKNYPYGFELNMEFFAIGQQIGCDRRILLDHQTSDFLLSEENDFYFSIKGNEVQLLDYTLNKERRGTRYDGYLVLIRDINGRIIAHKESSKGLFRNLENLSKLKVGWYFDDECRRILPKQPQHFEPRNYDRHRASD